MTSVLAVEAAPPESVLTLDGMPSRGELPRVPAPALAAWAATAAALAGGDRVRISSDGGRTYPRSRERGLPAAPPTQPAAVMIYNSHGNASCLPADLDVGRGGVRQVEADLHRLQTLLERCGATVITDRSPNGGRHLYVPWATPVPFHELRPVMVALAGLLPSLDILPAVNLRAGCLRPPGSRHRTGGWQELTTPLEQATHIAQHGNGPHVWATLQELLAPRRQPQPSAFGTAPPPATLSVHAGGCGPHERLAHTQQVPRPGGPRPLSAETLRLAQHGEYDMARYATPSQARQRVHAAAAGAGWHFGSLLEQLHSGQWGGLADLYSRYRPSARAERIAADWVAAVRWIEKRDARPAADAATQNASQGLLPKATHNSHTREPPTHGGGAGKVPGSSGRDGVAKSGALGAGDEYQFIRSWWNAALRAERSRYLGRGGLVRRLLLRALANAAQKRGSRYLEFGCRSLSLATGVDHSTVAAALRQLRSESDPLVVLLEDRRGVRGDLYELALPAEFADTLQRRDWRPGRIEAVEPVFRTLGLPVAFVYEQLNGHQVSSFELADRALVSHRGAQQALKALSEHGLATRQLGGWVRGPACPADVARALGVDEAIEAIHVRHRTERSIWQVWLGARTRQPATHPAAPGRARASARGPASASRDAGALWAGGSAHPSSDLAAGPEPPAEEQESVLQLLYRVLGAVPVPA